MIAQTLEQAGRLTHDHNPTYTLALLENDTNTNWHKKHIFIRSLTHVYTHRHTYPGYSDKTGIMEYETNTRAVND